MKTAVICVIGNEILCGRTHDTNSHYLAKELDALGVRVRHIGVVPDEMEAIIGFIHQYSPLCDYLFACGGIGPTPDDITREAVARAFDRPLHLHPEAEKTLRAGYKNRITEARLSMGLLPEGCRLIENPLTWAPGFVLGNVYVLAGIPRILEAMFEPLRHELRSGVIYSEEIPTRAREGEFAPFMKEMMEKHPDVSIGSYPLYRDPVVAARILLRSSDEARLHQAAEEMRAGLKRFEGAG